MAPTFRPSAVWELLTARSSAAADSLGGPAGGPLSSSDGLYSSTRVFLSRRDSYNGPDPSKGVLDPHDINNVGFFVLFALIGLAFVVTGIWFFFWAKNGGFHFSENDWDDYKTTVLRRKGPNGTLLSGATESTDLGGGSVYHDVADNDGRYDDYDYDENSTAYHGASREDRHRYQDDEGRTVMTATTGITGITAGPSEPDKRDARKRKKEMRERKKREEEREKRRRARGEKERKDRERERKEAKGKSGRRVGESGEVEDDEAEREAQEQLRSYRHEKAARVGGINKDAEGSQWDGSTAPSHSNLSGSGASDSLLSNKQGTPTKPGIRKVYSTAERVEAERQRNEARERRRERRREAEAAASAASGSESPRRQHHRRNQSSVGGSSNPATPSRTARRDFSFQTGPEAAESALSESLLTSSSGAGTSDLGTKSYHHPRPELRAQRQREREERRARRGGYSRGRDDEH